MDSDRGIHGTACMNFFFKVFLSFNLNRRNSDTVTSYTSHTGTLGCYLEFPRLHPAPSHSQLEWLQPCCLGTQPTVSCQFPKPTCVGRSAQVSPECPTHSILTVPTPGPAFEDESIWHSPVATEI